MTGFAAVFLLALAAAVGTQLWLAVRHTRHVAAHRARVPEAFAHTITLTQHQKAADYTVAKTRLEMAGLTYHALLLLAWTVGGGLELLDRLWRGLHLSHLTTGWCVAVSVVFAAAVLDLPLAAYRIFVIEQRFGFNHTRPALFVTDLVKEAVLGLLVGGPLIALFLWLMRPVEGNPGLLQIAPLWWLAVWLAWFAFALFMLWLYPALIAPLFNKFTPLADEALHERIRALLARTGFASRGVFVMDGSRRSAHGNAYFSGLGRNRRIVFFDTLLGTLSAAEIEAVLAHELGHYKRRHIHKRLAGTAALSLCGLLILDWLIDQGWFYSGLGVSTPSNYAALLLFMFAMPVFASFLDPLLAHITRRHEFEADDYAAQQSDARALIAALVKLYEENAATLTPDPLYSAFHDSHPPAATRIAHLAARTAA